jgi:beta-lactamase regulating signal transducer with metallopeptidase domain
MTGEAAAVILVCFALWLLGLLLFWLTVLCRYGQMKRALRRLRPAEDPEVGRLLAWERLWLGIREPVEVYFLSGSAGVFSPCAVGLRSSALILPAELWARLSERERDAVVAHELMHIRKRDNLRNLLLLVFHSVFWFAPVLRIALRTFRQDLEYLRDAQVLGETATRRERRRYVEAILAVAEASAKHYRPALHSGMLTGSGAGFRIRLLRRGEKKAVPAALALLLWALVFAAMPAVLYVLRHILPLEVIG